MTHLPKPKTEPRSARQLQQPTDPGSPAATPPPEHPLSRALASDTGEAPSGLVMVCLGMLGAAIVTVAESILT